MTERAAGDDAHDRQRARRARALKALGALGDGDELQRVVGAADTLARADRARAGGRRCRRPRRWSTTTSRSCAPRRSTRSPAAEERFGAPLLYLLARYALLQQYARARPRSPPARAARPRHPRQGRDRRPARASRSRQLALELLLSGGRRPGHRAARRRRPAAGGPAAAARWSAATAPAAAARWPRPGMGGPLESARPSRASAGELAMHVATGGGSSSRCWRPRTTRRRAPP